MLSVRVSDMKRVMVCGGTQVLGCSLEAHVLKSDNSALAKDCRKEMKAVTTRLSKLGRRVPTPYPHTAASPRQRTASESVALAWSLSRELLWTTAFLHQFVSC